MKNTFQFAYTIQSAQGIFLKPHKIEVWDGSKETALQHEFRKPLHYLDDALLGLGIYLFSSYLKSPLFRSTDIPYTDYLATWKKLNPIYSLYFRFQPRAKALRQYQNTPQGLDRFLASLRSGMQATAKPWGIDLEEMRQCLDAFAMLEEDLKVPLLFNFDIDFSPQVVEELHVLYGMLFHLRALIGIDHNRHPDVAVHEGCTVDPFGDYLPKAEFIVNDAMIYHQFQKLNKSLPTTSNTHFERADMSSVKAWLSPLQASFQQYAHNACQLVDNLPEEFLKALKPQELEEALYLIQMDWLFGTPAGLLFRIREELYALDEGYEKVFWRDFEGHHLRPSQPLRIATSLTDEDIRRHSVAA